MKTVKERIADMRADRDAKIRALHDRGWSLRRIGARYGLTHVRVYQILKPR